MTHPEIHDRLALIVVDEAHLVAQWDKDFRTDYSSLGQLRSLMGPARPRGPKLIREEEITPVGLGPEETIQAPKPNPVIYQPDGKMPEARPIVEILKNPNSGIDVKGKKDDVGELTEMIKNLRVEVVTLKNRSPVGDYGANGSTEIPARKGWIDIGEDHDMTP